MQKQIKFTARKNNRLAIVLVLLASLFQTVNAQIIRSKTQTIKTQKKPVVFKGAGIRQKIPQAEQPGQERIVRSLTTAEKTAVLKEAMSAGSVAVNNSNFSALPYAELSARSPYAADRGYLIFWGLLTVNPKIPSISFINGGLYEGVEIVIKPDQPGKWYLIDCKVGGEGSAPFFITGPDGNKAEFSNFADGHLQSFLVSQNTDWQWFFIHRQSGWKFYSCEVTTPAQ
jgi:hypothetical protein